VKESLTAKVALGLAAVSLLGSGCVQIRVLESNKTAVPSITKTPFAENQHISVGRTTVALNQAEHELTLYRLKQGNVELALERPDTSNKKIHLSVAGTYTSPADKPEGFIVHRGEIIQMRERMAWNGAAFFKQDGTLSIFATNNGKLLTKTYLQTVSTDKASLIQAHLLVDNGVAEKLLPQTPYQRRALVTFKDNSIAVIETVDTVDLQTFANLLVELKVDAAINLDMGQWSEGWYRDPISGQTRSIGYLTSATDKQSNWILFTE